MNWSFRLEKSCIRLRASFGVSLARFGRSILNPVWLRFLATAFPFQFGRIIVTRSAGPIQFLHNHGSKTISAKIVASAQTCGRIGASSPWDRSRSQPSIAPKIDARITPGTPLGKP